MELQTDISNLIIKQDLLEKAEEMLINYLKENPQDVDGWSRLVILETLAPLEDYERATEYLHSALRIDKDNSVFIVLLLFFTEWYLGGMDESLIKTAEKLKKTASRGISSISTYVLAWHFKSEDIRKFELLLNESIQEFPEYVTNYTDLGKHYLANGNNVLGEKMIREGLANVILIYKNSDNDYDPTDVTRFINERITGIFMTEDNYRSRKVLIQS